MVGFDEIFSALVWLPVQLALLIWYPVSMFFDAILQIINYIYVPFAVVLNGIITLINNFMVIPQVIMVNFFPGIWITICVAIITFILALRLYSFVKGITIFGFRIGG